MKVPQTFQLDSIRFQTSLFEQKRDNPKTGTEELLLGKERVSNPMNMNSFLFLPPFLTRDLDKNISIGTSLGASLSGMNVNIHGAISDEMNELIHSYEPSIILDLSVARYDPNPDMFEIADSIWIDLSEPETKTLLSNSHQREIFPPEIVEKKDLIHLVSMLKEIKDIPLIVSINGRNVARDIDSILVTSADAVHIDCGFDRTGEKGGPAYRGLTSEPVTTVIEAMKHFEVFKAKDRGVKLLISAPIRYGTDMIKLKALGADAFGPSYLIDSALRDLSERYDKDLDWDIVGEKVNNTIEDLKQKTRSSLNVLGKHDLNNVGKDDLCVDNYHTASLTGLPLMGYGKEIPFWRY